MQFLADFWIHPAVLGTLNLHWRWKDLYFVWRKYAGMIYWTKGSVWWTLNDLWLGNHETTSLKFSLSAASNISWSFHGKGTEWLTHFPSALPDECKLVLLKNDDHRSDLEKHYNIKCSSRQLSLNFKNLSNVDLSKCKLNQQALKTFMWVTHNVRNMPPFLDKMQIFDYLSIFHTYFTLVFYHQKGFKFSSYSKTTKFSTC